MSKKDIILVSEFNEDSIKVEVESLVKKFVLNNVTKKIKDLKQKNIKNKKFDEKKVKEELLKEFTNSPETEEYRKLKTNEITEYRKNYRTLRNSINDLNEIDQFSPIFEKLKLQTVELKTIEELVTYSHKLFEKQPNTFKEIVETKKTYIENHINQYINNSPLNFRKKYNRLFDENDILGILLILREMYNIPKNIDSMELYDKYDMLDNLFVSNLLSEICFKNIYETSIIDIFNQSSNELTKLVSKKLVSNKILGILLYTTINKSDADFPIITNNSITCYDNTYITTESNQKLYVNRTVGELLIEITNDDNKNIKKEQRKQIYMTYNGIRPTTNEYHYWNGFQIIDIDLKQWTTDGGNIQLLKQKIYEHLCDYHWFLFITYSSSWKGLHIWTKVTPPHHIYLDVKENNRLCKYWHMVNYYHKTSVIYDIIYQIKDKFNFTEKEFTKTDEKSKYTSGFEFIHLDNSVGRITSGIRLPYDNNVLVNNNFLDLHVSYEIHKTPTPTFKIILRDTIISRKWFDRINELVEYSEEDAPSQQIDTSNLILKGYDVSKISEIPISQIKYTLRYNICNTLAALMGKEGLPLAHKILRSSECKNVDEINSFYASALRNKKEPTKIAIDVLSRIGLIKQIDDKLDQELTDKYKLFMKKQLLKMLEDNEEKQYDIYLKNHEYLNDYEKELLSDKNFGFKSDKINLVHAPPGSGKTHLVKTLAKKKRVLLVLPFISVINNKIETDEEISKIFEVFYDDKDITKMESGINVCMTFDKFSRCNYEKISRQFDYIFIDENHLITNSQYRINATSNSLRKIKQLYFISSNDPFAAKIILMTGTPTGDSFFFGKNGNFIKVYKKSHEKKLEFHICGDSLDVSSRLAYKAYQLLTEKYTLIIPSNQGNIWMENMVGQIEFLLQRPVKYGYYKRENKETDICTLINEQNTVGDYEIVFCTTYLSVGIDLNDTNKKFATLYTGNFSSFEIEQFNSRIRKKGIQSYYFIKTLDSEGKVDMSLFEEPQLQLKLTEDDILNFKDDKEIVNAKQEFIAQYDPVLKVITTPGFSVIGNKIRFDKENYELIMFENKYEECFKHPLKIVRELAKYGYNISVSNEFEGLSLDEQKKLEEIGKESAYDEKIKRNQLLVGTFIELININTYKNNNGLEFNGVVDWINKNKYNIVERRDSEKFVDVIFNLFAQPEKCIVKSKIALEKMLGFARFLLMKYSEERIIEIFNDFIDEKGILHVSKLERTVNLLKLVESGDSNEISEPITKVIEEIYEYIDSFVFDKNKLVSNKIHQQFIDKLTSNYIDYLGINIRTKYGLDKIRESITSLFNDIAVKTASKAGVKFDYNKIPDTDSKNILNSRSIDSLVNNIFRITMDVSTNTNKTREKHIKLETQNY